MVKTIFKYFILLIILLVIGTIIYLKKISTFNIDRIKNNIVEEIIIKKYPKVKIKNSKYIINKNDTDFIKFYIISKMILFRSTSPHYMNLKIFLIENNESYKICSTINFIIGALAIQRKISYKHDNIIGNWLIQNYENQIRLNRRSFKNLNYKLDFDLLKKLREENKNLSRKEIISKYFNNDIIKHNYYIKYIISNKDKILAQFLLENGIIIRTGCRSDEMFLDETLNNIITECKARISF